MRAGGCGLGGRGGGQHGADGGVALVGLLGTARVVGTAGGSAGAVAFAVVHALRAPLGADEVGEGLRVLGDVGRDAVIAHAVVGQVILWLC